jgi:hypothetical protein
LASQPAAGHQTVYALPANPTASDFAAAGRPHTGPAYSAGPVHSGGDNKGCASLRLAAGEILLEAVWQPSPSALCATAAEGQLCKGLSPEVAAALRDQQALWLTLAQQPLLALRTTRRVLLCNAQLRVLNEAVFVEHAGCSSGLPTAQATGTDSIASAFLRRLQASAKRPAAEPPSMPLSPSVCRDAAVGVTWLGAALCYTCESGAVHYLLPAPAAAPSVTGGSLASAPVLRAMGLRSRAPGRAGTAQVGRSGSGAFGDDGRGVLCTLPRNLSTSAPCSVLVVAVLADRILLAYLRSDDTPAAPLVAFTQRPMNPLEPLALSLVALERLSPGGGAGGSRRDLLSLLLSFYVSPRSDGPAASGAGARPSGQVTRRLALALATLPAVAPAVKAHSVGVGPLSGAALTAFVAGTHPAGGELPLTRWIPSGFKYWTRVRAGLHKLAALELLSVRSELQEMLLDSEAYGGAALPHPQRALSTQLTAAALLLFVQAASHPQAQSTASAATAAAFRELCAQQKALAQRLLDIAGDYSTLVSTLAPAASSDRATAAVVTSTVDVVPRAGRAQFLALQSHLRRLKDSGAAPSLPVEAVSALMHHVLQERVSLAALGASDRPKTLTAAGAVLPIADCAGPVDDQLAALEARQKEHASKNGGQQGPPLVQLAPGTFAAALAATPGSLSVLGPRCAGLLALDLLEDWMGVNLQLELSSANAEDLFGGGPGGDQTIAGGGGADGAGAAGGLYMGQPLPAGWVEGVGVGAKEHEVLSGYWRFSDAAYPGEEAFHSCSLRPSGARLVFLDLSRFEGPGFELYCPDAGSLRVEPTSSAVDTGEKHDNVKSLCDVVYPPAAGTGSGRGLRCPVPRGSQLDIGPFHVSANRSKLTVELMVGLDETFEDAGSGRHVLLQRKVHDEAGASEQSLWTLFVAADGAVCFNFGDEIGAALRSAPGTLPLLKPAEGGGAVWSHVAFVLDATKAPAAVTDGSVAQPAVAVTLYVRGEVVAEGKLAPAAVRLSALENTMLHVGPDLCGGWRLTELRLWADRREASDLEGQRDNYLSMAMKRKRLQLRVRGTKKLFTAYREIEVPQQAATAVRLPVAAREGDEAAESAGPSAASGSAGSAAAVGPKKVLGGPLLGGKSALAGPGLTAPKPSQSSMQADEAAAPSAPSGMLTGAPALGVASTSAPAPAAPPMTARERRLSQLKAGVTAVSVVGVLKPPKPSDLGPSPATTAGTEAPTQQQQRPLTSAAAPEPSPGKSSKVSFASFDSAPASGAATISPALPPPQSALKKPLATAQGVPPAATAPSQATFLQMGALSALGLPRAPDSADAYSTAKTFATPLCWAECRLPAAAGEGWGLHSVDLPSAEAAQDAEVPEADMRTPFSQLPAQLRSTAESAICILLPSATARAGAAADPGSRYRVAVLAKQTLHVFTTSTSAAGPGPAELVAQMAMGAVRLAHWAFLSPDLVLMVSSTSAFTIRVTPPPQAAGEQVAQATAQGPFTPKPVKIFDRCDLRDLAR